MQFICQIALAELGLNTDAQMAYLFMTGDDDDNFIDGTYEPDGGENALILQPGTTGIPTQTVVFGPNLYRMVEKAGMDRLQPEPCEFRVEIEVQDDVEFIPDEERFKMSEEEAEKSKGVLEENKLGGSPVFLQGDEFPFKSGSQLLLQLDSCSVPFYINFGDSGVGYAFLNENGDEGRFLWQCC